MVMRYSNLLKGLFIAAMVVVTASHANAQSQSDRHAKRISKAVQEGDYEKAGKEVGKYLESASEEAVDKSEKALKKAGKEVGKYIENTSEEAVDMAEKAYNKTKKEVGKYLENASESAAEKAEEWADKILKALP